MKTLIVLMGPQAAGKTTYARSYYPRAFRISQDDQGRDGHLQEFEMALGAGTNIIVDRINHRRYQRLRYVLPARDASYHIHYVWFLAGPYTCLRRLIARSTHPTVDPYQTDHEKMLNRYFREFEPPDPEEYDSIEFIPVYQKASIQDMRNSLQGRRTWVIGDVHGCYKELRELLENGGYQPGKDYLVFLGDLVNRGPGIAETLEWVRAAPDTVVIKGNHDERFARYLAGARLEPTKGLKASINAVQGWPMEQRYEYRRWIESWPTIIRLPDLEGKPFYAVHAAILGYRPMDEQDEQDCICGRYLSGSGGRQAHVPWYNSLRGDRKIAFGHIPHISARPVPDAFALDGNAVRGGLLRALVMEPAHGTHAHPRVHVLEVQSRRYDPSIKEPLDAREHGSAV